MEIKVKPITDQRLKLFDEFMKDMEKTCPIWAWSKKQDNIRKNKKF